jgi:hypothetical protein
MKVVFTCQCSTTKATKEKQKLLSSEGEKNFLEQLEKVYSSNSEWYFQVDKEGSL